MKKLNPKNIVLFINLSLAIIFSHSVKSLNNELPDHDLYGREKLEFYIQKSKSFIGESSTEVRHNALLAYNIASANHDTVYLALACSYVGASYVMENQLDTAIVLLEKAEYYALKSNEKDPLIRVYNNLGTIYELNENLNNAYKYYTKANKIIEDNQLSNYYKPRLSLAAIYCKRNERDKAIALLTKIIEDSRNNSDLYFELLARLNLLETEIYTGKHDLKKVNEEFQLISELLQKNEIEDLQTRFLELKTLINIENGQLVKAFALIGQLPHISIEDKKTKSILIGRIKEAYIERANIQQIGTFDSIQKQINKEIFNDYEYQVSLNHNSLYELSNQNLILDQIRSDKNELEKKTILYKTLFRASIVVLIVFLIAVSVLFFSYKFKDKNKINYSKYDPDNFQERKINEDFFETFEFCPIFKLDKNFNYLEANNLFYQLSGKDGKESLRGSNDFDLPWREKSEKLVSIYKEIEKKVQAKYIVEDLFNCKSEILFLPLIKDEQFRGVLGILIPVNKDDELDLNEKMTMKDDKEEGLHGTSRILLVDDEIDNIILIKSLLKKYDCILKTADNGFQALEILKEEQFDFVLMDLEMPEMSGYETVMNISEDERNKIQVLALTAHSKNEISEKDLKLFDDILTKPISRNMLVSKLSLSLKTSEN